MGALPLAGWRVLVPRAGEFGDRLASRLLELGATPVMAPLIGFEPPRDRAELERALDEFAAGAYDWLVVTSATTVAFLGSALDRVPAGTRIAAVGPATAATLRAAGASVDLVPSDDHSAQGLLADWVPGEGRVFLPQSEIAAPTLTLGLAGLGFEVDAVAAYRTVAVPLDPAVRAALAAGDVDAVLLTSGSTARHLADQCERLSASTRVACIGEPTASAARAAGLRVDAVAARSDGESLIEALVHLAT